MKWAAWEGAMPVIFYDPPPPQKKPNAEDKGAGC